MAHHLLKKLFLKKIFLLNDLDLLFSAKKNFEVFFFKKYLQKLLTLSLHTIKSFQIGKKSPKTSSTRIFIFLSS
jgi:hypothetical protein